MLKQLFKTGSFRLRVTQLVTGTAAGQALAFLLLPVLGRVYSPADIGAFTSAMAVALIIAAVATGRYEFALVPAKDAKESRSVGFLALVLSAVVCVAAALLIGLGVRAQLGFIGLFGEALYFVPVLGFAVAAYQTLSYWFIRAERYMSLAFARFLASGGTVVIALAVIPFDTSELGLMLGATVGYACAGLLLFSSIGYRRLRVAFKRLQWKELHHYSRAHSRFPIYYLPAAILDAASLYMPVLLIAHLYTKDLGGQYALALRVLWAPLMLISIAVGQVFLHKFSELSSAGHEEKKRFLLDIWARLFMFGALPAACLWIWSRPLFELFIGPNWTDAGLIAGILAPYCLFVFVSFPTTGAFIVLGLQRDLLIYHFLVFACRVAGFILGAQYFGLYETLRILVAVEIMFLIGLNRHLLRRLG